MCASSIQSSHTQQFSPYGNRSAIYFLPFKIRGESDLKRIERATLLLLKARWYNKVSQYEQNKYWVGKLTSLAFPSKQTVRPLKLGNILPLTRGFEKSDIVNEII